MNSTSKVNIKEPRYTNAIEAFLSGRDFFSFVTQNQEDMEKFLREVSGVYLRRAVQLGSKDSTWLLFCREFKDSKMEE